MSDDDKIDTLFLLAITAEELAEKFYRGLIMKFSHLPEVSKFWNEMLEDERQHAQKLRDIRDSLTPDQLQSPANPYVLQKMKEILRYSVEDLLESVKTLNDAYDKAYELEYSEINQVYKFLTTKFLPHEGIKEIDTTQKDHLKKIMLFPLIFGGSEEIKNIKIKS